MVMHKLNCMTYLFQIPLNTILSKAYLFSKQTIEIASTTVLHHQINMVIVIKERVEMDDIGMLKETLNLYLSNELIYVAEVASKDPFGNFFDGTHKLS